MSYHFYDMGFKDGFKKALQQLDEQTQNLQEQLGPIDWSQVSFTQQQWAAASASLSAFRMYNGTAFLTPTQVFQMIRAAGVTNLSTARQMAMYLHSSYSGGVGFGMPLATLMAYSTSQWAASSAALQAAAAQAGVALGAGTTSVAGLLAYAAAMAGVIAGVGVGWYFRPEIEAWVLEQFGFDQDFFDEIGYDPNDKVDIPDEFIRDHSNIEKVDPQGELGTRPLMVPYGYQGNPGDASAISNYAFGGGG